MLKIHKHHPMYIIYPHLPVPNIFGIRCLVTWYIDNWKPKGSNQKREVEDQGRYIQYTYLFIYAFIQTTSPFIGYTYLFHNLHKSCRNFVRLPVESVASDKRHVPPGLSGLMAKSTKVITTKIWRCSAGKGSNDFRITVNAVGLARKYGRCI